MKRASLGEAFFQSSYFLKASYFSSVRASFISMACLVSFKMLHCMDICIRRYIIIKELKKANDG